MTAADEGDDGFWFPEICDRLWNDIFNGEDVGDWLKDALEPWCDQNLPCDGLRSTHAEFRSCPSDARAFMCHAPVRHWNLYALSRISDLMLLRFPVIEDWSLDRALSERLPDEDGYLGWFDRLGFTALRRLPFHPFFHEIVAVEPASDPNEPISILSERWPGLLFGDLMFSRAGVVVRGGASHIDPRTAVSSRLIYAHCRNGRKCWDEGCEWGHNSQWRSCIRYDYLTRDCFIYNLGRFVNVQFGDIDLTGPPPPGKETYWARSIELCRHRCFITGDAEEFPEWWLAYSEPRPRIFGGVSPSTQPSRSA